MKREMIWDRLPEEDWDVLIIGGGISGAGIFREAVRNGLRALLLEQRDFAWGTSSRSSKLVHGGLRYLREGRLLLTRASVQEREHLLHDAPGLVEPLGFLQTVYEGDVPGRWLFEVGLTIYDLLALQWDHQYYSPEDFRLLAPHIAENDLEGGFRFEDAQTDDARLVLRVIQEAQQAGGVALNYARVENLLFDENGSVNGVKVRDDFSGQTHEVTAKAVINATGAWVDDLRGEFGAPARIRPLRGSHLIFPAWRLPVAQAVSLMHPYDGRPVFIVPWEGVTLVGTTDVDHQLDLQEEPRISPEEVAYLMAAVEAVFPAKGIELEDVLSTFAGVRPVIGSGQADPSKESRDHVLWDERGLLTVTGGKLTTFRLIANQVLEALRERFPGMPDLPAASILDSSPQDIDTPGLDAAAKRRLTGRFGVRSQDLAASANPGDLVPVPGTRTLWAEIRWAACSEQVCHLADLMLRRTRLGLLLPQGGAEILPGVLEICAQELGWDKARQAHEAADYLELWQKAYSLPPHIQIPDWRLGLALAQEKHRVERQIKANLQRNVAVVASLAGIALGVIIAGLALRWRAKIRHG